MALQLLTPPAVEPVTLTEAKTHLRIDTDAEDTFVTSLIATSRLQIEAATELALISQSWRLTLDCWPFDGIVSIPVRPLDAVTEIRVSDQDGNFTALDPVSYAVDVVNAPGRIVSRSGYWTQPGVRLNGIEIDFTAGYGTAGADVPEPVRQALMVLVAHWYENREPAAIGSPDALIPPGVSSLLAPFMARKL